MKSKVLYKECSVAEFAKEYPLFASAIGKDFFDDTDYVVRFVPDSNNNPITLEIGYASDPWYIS